jgi:hypothetical protein
MHCENNSKILVLQLLVCLFNCIILFQSIIILLLSIGNDWIPDYESPTANCENDSILGSLLDCNDGLSLPAITRPIFRSTKDDESETQFSEYHRLIHEADSVELQELNNIHISINVEHESEETSNRLYDEADVMDEIWENKELFGSEENNLSTLNHGNQSESKWYVPANEVEVKEVFIW